MRRFAQLYQQLDATTATGEKLAALRACFADAQVADADKAWALWLLSGGKLRRIAGSGELRQWIVEASGHPAWLVEESYHHVGDLAETATLLLDDPVEQDDRPLHHWIENTLLPVAAGSPEARREAVLSGWRVLGFDERLAFNKLLTGALRIGVSQRTVQQALAADREKVLAFLKERGFTDTELEARPLQVQDLMARDYAQGNVPFRFNGSGQVLVKTSRVADVASAALAVDPLIQGGIQLGGDGEGASGPRYQLRGFNDIKAPLLAEATRNAREQADKFAAEAGASLGPLKNANQGAIRITGTDGKVNGLKYKDRATNEEHLVPLEGVFVQIGLVPNTEFLKGTVELTRFGEIVVDAKGHTNVPGVFAAGDCTTVPYKQIVIAAGEGAKAALSAFDHLIRQPVVAAASEAVTA